MARKRTAKELGQRHDFHYFKSWTLFRRLKIGLSIALPLAAAVWLAASAAQRNDLPYSSGPLSAQHNFIGTRCKACHTVEKPMFGRAKFTRHASDAACQQCHAAPQHQALEAFTPTCSSCHTEHEGRASLKDVSDKFCVQCHASLKTKSGVPHFATAVLSFKDSHPEFRAVRDAVDHGAIKLNHAVHLKAGLLGPKGPVQMECADCHRTPADQNEPWRYEVASTAPAATPAALHQPKGEEQLTPGANRAYMAPVSFARNCAACHELQFDKHFDITVPHTTPAEVHDFVVRKLRDYITAHPGALQEHVTMDRRIPGLPAPAVAHNANEWVEMRTAEAEILLWRKTCKQCHTLEFKPSSDIPTVVPPNQPPRWFQNARFSHYAHEGVTCTSCHTKARASKETSDVLLPGIETCRLCHRGDAREVGSAQSGCFLCHQYHNWSHPSRRVNGNYTIPELSEVKTP